MTMTLENTFIPQPVVAVVGLGYVGLPLAVAFAKRYRALGFDLSAQKIAHYQTGVDPSGEVEQEDLAAALAGGEGRGLVLSTDPDILKSADVIIVAVPTPVDIAHVPDFSPLVSASEIVGAHMKKGVTVVYESTVYPGATEDICVPILESASGLAWRRDFHVGYSPERVNPGDKTRTITRIVKVVSGDEAATLAMLGDLYASVITAGIHRAPSIKVAEAAKVIENTQRDVNIALMNELALLFGHMGLDTLDVLEAAGTKWNFLPFRPGLVGGHCIGVDPYYLTHKAAMLGYHPDVILAGRRINDSMAAHVAREVVKQIIQTGRNIKGAKINLLGLTFKENCPDLRNSKVADIVRELTDYGCEVFCHDPIADPAEATREYGLTLCEWRELPVADAVVAAVSHHAYLERTPLAAILEKLSPGGVFADVKSAYSRETISSAGFRLWRL
jgi:UDP-N-acetyl-D-galactosamine dehydrogenase